MTQKNQKQAKIKKKRSNVTVLVFWVCLILLLIPFGILGWILFSSSMSTHTPVIGNRYDGDLDPAITTEQLNTIKTKAEALAGVQSVDVQLATGTLRIYADIDDNQTPLDANLRANEIWGIVSENLDPSIYFTKTDTKKMYDLEIHSFTIPERTDAEGENFVYIIETKTSSMENPEASLVSSPRNEELAQQLRDDVVARKAAAEAAENAEGDITVGGTEVHEGTVENESAEEGTTEEQPAE